MGLFFLIPFPIVSIYDWPVAAPASFFWRGARHFSEGACPSRSHWLWPFCAGQCSFCYFTQSWGEANWEEASQNFDAFSPLAPPLWSTMNFDQLAHSSHEINIIHININLLWFCWVVSSIFLFYQYFLFNIYNVFFYDFILIT